MNESRFRIKLILVFVTLQAVHCYEDIFDKSSSTLFYAWKLAESINDFSFNLQHRLSDNFDDNIVFSPLSVANTLAMLHFGARGRTARELGQLLGYEEANITRSMASRAYKYLLTEQLVTTKPRQFTFDMANAIFIKSSLGLNPTYKKRVEEFYQSPIKYIDFVSNSSEAIAEVNEMVRKKTRNKIKDVIRVLDPNVDIIIVNAAYFKGLWKTMFRSNNIKEGIFYNKGYIQKNVTMMEQENTFYHMKNHEISILEVPFKGNNASMLIMLPLTRDGLTYVEGLITHYSFFQYLNLMEMKRVLLTLPKFKFSYTGELSPSLQTLGAIQLFQPSLANLGGMIRDESVAIGEIRHKAFIEVTESGVEASAATVTTSVKAGSNSKVDAIFNVEHPFMFALLDKRNGLFLFMGRVWSLD